LHPPEICDGRLQPPNKTKCWIIFWLGFLACPALALGAMKLNIAEGFFTLAVLGPIVAGYAVARRFSKTGAGWFFKGIAFTLAVVVVHFGIFFIGCVAGLSRSL
jgi:hypothetical protein